VATGKSVSSKSSGADYERKVRIFSALTALWLKVAHRSGEEADIEDRIKLYADQLMAWPERTVLACLAEHPKRSIYWPAWKELEDLRGEFEAASRPARVVVPPEHRLLPPAGTRPEGQEPFATKREWLDFADAMRKLRDSNTRMLARDQLLAIGMTIEARQKPHAQSMGWSA
jgi:hypothetical protein